LRRLWRWEKGRNYKERLEKQEKEREGRDEMRTEHDRKKREES
jgi:hypothetical protein